METGEEPTEAVQMDDEEEAEFEFDPNRSDRRIDSVVLNIDPTFAYLARLTAALAALNLQVRVHIGLLAVDAGSPSYVLSQHALIQPILISATESDRMQDRTVGATKSSTVGWANFS